MIAVADSMTYAELAEVRRRLLRLLDSIDQDNEVEEVRKRLEGPSSRIHRLRSAGLIPREIASLMLMILTFRNVAEYEDVMPQGPAAATVWSAWDAVKQWAAKRTVKYGAGFNGCQ